MSFVTDAVVKASVAAGLHQDVADMQAYWTTAIADANAAAYRQIVDHFLTLGFTKAQVDAWDSGADYQKFLARYQALIDGAGDKPDVGEWRAELDYWRGKLGEIQNLVVDDELPGQAETGSIVGHGNLKTSDDIFRLSPRGRGRVTEW